jgi:hypothetical protein
MNANRVFLAGAIASAVVSLVSTKALASNIATIEAQSSGTLVTLDSSPVITAILSQPGTFGGQTYTGWSFLAQDSSGSIDIYGFTGRDYTPTVGDTISVSGTYSPFHQIPEITNVTAISASSSGGIPAAPVIETISQLNVGTLPQSVAGYLVEVDNVTISGASGSFPAGNLSLTITDSGNNSMVLYYWYTSFSTCGAMSGTPLLTGPVDIIGFASVYPSTRASPQLTPIQIIPVTAPPPSFTPTGMATLNGTQENSITLVPNANLTGSFPYSAADGSSAGANMIAVVGLVNSANQWVGGDPQVVYNGVPSQAGTSGNASWSNLVVPSSAGTYQLWFQSFLTANASGSINSFEESPPTAAGNLAGIIATVTTQGPTVITGSASAITANSATLNGSVNPNGLPTTAYFQWGRSTAYGNTVPNPALSCGSGNNTLGVSVQNLSGLASSTTYHYCLVASSSAGTAYGGDQTFATLSGAPPSTVSATLSTLTVTPSSAPADGITPVTATVTLRDANDNLVAGKSVTFYASEVNSSGIPVHSSLSLRALVNPTDANGQASAIIIANTPGTVTITAIDTTDNIAVQQPVTATFTTAFNTVVPPNSDIQSAIESLYEGSAAILNGTPPTGTSLFTIANGEGEMARYFYIAAGQDAIQAFTDTFYFGVSELIVGLPVLEDIAIKESLNIQNVSLDPLLSELVKSDLSSSGVLVTRAHNVATICDSCQEELQSIEQIILPGVPAAVNYNSSQYINDLYLRQEADQVLQEFSQQVHDYFSALQSASQNAGQVNFSTALIKNSTLTFGTSILNSAADETGDDIVSGTGAALGALPAAINIWQKYQNENQNMDAHIALGFNIAGIAGTVSDISNNVNTAFSEIAQGLTPNPVTGQILSASLDLTKVTNRTPGSWLASQSINIPVTYITSAKADVILKNTSSSGSAAFDVYAEYAFDVNSFSAQGPVPGGSFEATTIPAGQTGELTWMLFDGNMGAVPSSISPFVTFDVLAGGSSGIYYIGSTSAGPFGGQSLSQTTIKDSPKRFGSVPQETNNNVVSFVNPIRCYVNQNPTNQTYEAQISVENPFVLSLTVRVTQPLPLGVQAFSTNGTLLNSSIEWTNAIAPSNAVGDTFTFSLSVTPGTQTNLPPPTVVFSDTNGNSLSLQGVAPYFNGLFPVQVNGVVPFGISGVDSPMAVTVRNLTDIDQTGSMTISLTDSTGNAVTNVSESFSVDDSGSTNLEFTLPGSLGAGSYSVTGSLSINGGTGQVLGGVYVVPSPPIMLNFGSTALSTNGFSMVLQGPAGNYLIEASPDISNPTNWVPILYYSSTNSPFYYYFTDPNATNLNQQFYRAVMH